MMNTLSPDEAATLASFAYSVADSELDLDKLNDFSLFRHRLKFGRSSIFSGRSGVVYQPESVFGFVGEGTDGLSGEMVVVCRGTEHLVDWLTDFHASVQLGPRGTLVHGGFNQTWKSYRKRLDASLSDFTKSHGRAPTRVHCVGHSLGAALSFLNADYFLSHKLNCSVYAFGAPRTGVQAFARSLSANPQANPVFRVSHVGDPVTMLPVFPFAHAPLPGPSYVVGAGKSAFVSFEHHKMGNYLKEAHGRTWDALRNREVEVTTFEIESWLTETNDGHRVVQGSALALSMAGRLLRWLLAQAFDSLGLYLTVGATVLDQVAGMIARGAAVSKAIARGALALVRTVFRFLGFAAESTYNMTVHFLRWMLELLFGHLRAMVTGRRSLV